MKNFSQILKKIDDGKEKIVIDKITEEQIPTFTSKLNGNTSIKSLTVDLEGYHLGKVVVNALASVLQTTQITQLKLADIFLTDENIQALAVALPSSEITYLGLGDATIDNERLEAIAAFLPATKITHLELWQNPFNKAGLQALTDVLPNTQITELNIEAVKNIYTFDCVSSLLNIIPDTKLTELSFSLCGSTAAEVSKTIEFIACSNISTAIHMNNDRHGVLQIITAFNKSLQEGIIDNNLLLEACYKLINSDRLNALKGFITTHNIDLHYLIDNQTLFDLLINHKPVIRPLLEEINTEYSAKIVDTTELYFKCSKLIEQGNYLAVKELLLAEKIDLDKLIASNGQLSFTFEEWLGFLTENIHPEAQDSFSNMLRGVKIKLAGSIDNKEYTDIIFNDQ